MESVQCESDSNSEIITRTDLFLWIIIHLKNFEFFWRCRSEQATKCWLVDFDFYLVVFYWTYFFLPKNLNLIKFPIKSTKITSVSSKSLSLLTKFDYLFFFIGGINKILECELLLDERTVGLFMFCFYLDCFRYMADFWV